MDELIKYWPVIAFVAGLLLAAGAWAIRKGLASRDELQAETRSRLDAANALENRIADKLTPILAAQAELANRTLRIETEIRHLPSAEDISELKEQLGRSDARLESLDRELQSITRALTRVENHLLKGVAT